MFLPPYSPDLNPIEKAFRELKAYLKRNNWRLKEEFNGNFGQYLHWSLINMTNNAAGHFRGCHINIIDKEKEKWKNEQKRCDPLEFLGEALQNLFL